MDVVLMELGYFGVSFDLFYSVIIILRICLVCYICLFGMSYLNPTMSYRLLGKN